MLKWISRKRKDMSRRLFFRKRGIHSLNLTTNFRTTQGLHPPRRYIGTNILVGKIFENQMLNNFKTLHLNCPKKGDAYIGSLITTTFIFLTPGNKSKPFSFNSLLTLFRSDSLV